MNVLAHYACPVLWNGVLNGVFISYIIRFGEAITFIQSGSVSSMARYDSM